MMSLANQVYRRMFFKEKKTKYVFALIIAVSKKAKGRDSPVGPVADNLPCILGDMGSIPGGRKKAHMPQRN